MGFVVIYCKGNYVAFHFVNRNVGYDIFFLTVGFVRLISWNIFSS